MPYVPPDDLFGEGLPPVTAGRYCFVIDDDRYGTSEKHGTEYLLFVLSAEKYGTYTHFITVQGGAPKTTNAEGKDTTHHREQYGQVLRAVDYPSREYWDEGKKDPLPDLDSPDGQSMLRSMQGKKIYGHVGYWTGDDQDLKMLVIRRLDEVDENILGPESKPKDDPAQKFTDEDVPF